MTTTTNEITFQEAQDEYFADIEDMINEEIEAEASGHAAMIKERYQEHLRWCELADAGNLCRCCLIRPMATDNDLGYGAGYCEACMEKALDLMAVR